MHYNSHIQKVYKDLFIKQVYENLVWDDTQWSLYDNLDYLFSAFMAYFTQQYTERTNLFKREGQVGIARTFLRERFKNHTLAKNSIALVKYSAILKKGWMGDIFAIRNARKEMHKLGYICINLDVLEDQPQFHHHLALSKIEVLLVGVDAQESDIKQVIQAMGCPTVEVIRQVKGKTSSEFIGEHFFCVPSAATA